MAVPLSLNWQIIHNLTPINGFVGVLLCSVMHVIHNFINDLT